MWKGDGKWSYLEWAACVKGRFKVAGSKVCLLSSGDGPVRENKIILGRERTIAVKSWIR